MVDKAVITANFNVEIYEDFREYYNQDEANQTNCALDEWFGKNFSLDAFRECFSDFVVKYNFLNYLIGLVATDKVFDNLIWDSFYNAFGSTTINVPEIGDVIMNGISKRADGSYLVSIKNDDIYVVLENIGDEKYEIVGDFFVSPKDAMNFILQQKEMIGA